jgi:hypothetical protein
MWHTIQQQAFAAIEVQQHPVHQSQSSSEKAVPRSPFSGDLVALLVATLAAATLPLSASAISAYPGNAAVYAVFSVAFASMLAVAALPRTPYVAVYGCVFLWLGIWAKMTLHMQVDYQAVFGQSFMEPTGQFDFSPGAWDDVLLTCTVGALGMLTAVMGAKLFSWNRGLPERVSVLGRAPVWYPRFRFVVWAAVAAAVAGLVTVNETFAILKLGFPPATLLPWPVSGIYPWLFYVGLAVVIAVLSGWEAGARGSLGLPLTTAMASAWLLAASMLSRSAFIFQAGPYLLVLLREPKLRASLGVLQRVGVVAGFGILFAASLAAVTYSRYLVADRAPTHASDLDRAPQIAEGSARLELVWSATRAAVMSMAIDRWPGLEGVMTVSAAPGRGWSSLREILTARRTLKEVDIYTRMSGSPFSNRHTARFHYATIPGPIALWYVSGSRWVVFFGILVFGLIAIVLEDLVARLHRNPFLQSVVGAYLAVLVTQITPGLGQKMLSVATLLLACFALHAVARIGRNSPSQRWRHP